jgi:hypothetical protein
MTPLFGKKTSADKTVLIVDIENSSVGAALVRLSPGHAPKLFAEKRVALPMLPSVSAGKLLEETDKALRQALLQASTTAARMRNHPKLAPVGIISHVQVFVSPPWVIAHEKQGELDWDVEPNAKTKALHAIDDTFGALPITFHAASAAYAHATNVLFDQTPDLLLFTVGGEVSELTLLHGGVRAAYATVPLGRHFIVRTLQSHAGVSQHEADSLVRLSRHMRTETPAEEALFAAAAHVSHEFGAAARTLLDDTPVQGILVIAHEPVGEWVAQSLASHGLGDAFPAGMVVQALHTHHLAPHLAAHAARPDLVFMTHALFIGTQNKNK